MLAEDHLVLVFTEGAKGLSKQFSQRANRPRRFGRRRLRRNGLRTGADDRDGRGRRAERRNPSGKLA